MNFKIELEAMRKNFAENRPPKLHLHRPWWIFADDELLKIYKEKEQLLSYGEIYYACLLQANINLFKKFPPFDYPAQIVYSTSQETEENPLMLQETIEEIYSYKHSSKQPPKEWREIVKNIENEKDRTSFLFECGSSSVKITAKMQTVMVYRKHLPTRVLQGSVLPIIACPDKCDSVLILPSSYWTNEFKENWFKNLL